MIQTEVDKMYEAGQFSWCRFDSNHVQTKRGFLFNTNKMLTKSENPYFETYWSTIHQNHQHQNVKLHFTSNT